MTTIIVSDAKGLAAALSSVKGGDTIQLKGGDYGDFTIKSKTFATDVNIVSYDATNPAEFHSLTITNSQGINFQNVEIDFKPDATTLSFSSALKIGGSTDISFTGGSIHGGPAIAAPSGSGNVVGLPTGRGITIEKSSHVTIEDVDISQVHKGIAMSNSSDITIRGNDIHDVRTSPIVGGGLQRVLIEGNHLSNSSPNGWGNASKDHADFIHIWTDAKQDGPTKDLTIVGNTIEQGKGTAILGIFLDDNGRKIGFENVKISDNVIMNGNHQGIRVSNVFNSEITNNTLLQTSGTAKDAPGIIVNAGSHDLEISGNVTAFVSDTSTGAKTNDLSDNTLVQTFDPAAVGYYSSTLLDKVGAVVDPGMANDLVGSSINKTVAPAALTDGASTPATAYTLSITTDAGAKLQAKAGSHTLNGANGNDTLVGMGGNDVLKGGAGADYLTGNGGNDILFGGAGADKFVFGKDYPSTGGVDLIGDFSSLEGDRINVKSIDANTNKAGDDAFRFIGQDAFHHVAGELRYELKDGYALVTGDTNGDGIADFAIKVVGGNLTASDFML